MTRIAAQSSPLPTLDVAIAQDQAYWIDADLEITVCGPEGTLSRSTGRPWGLVGSSADCDVALAEGFIAEKALYFQATNCGVSFVDLAARASGADARRGWVGRDAVAVGPYRVSAVSRPTSQTDMSRSADLTAVASLPGRRPVIELSDVGNRHARIQLSRCLTVIGRSRPSNVRIRRREISAVHAALYVDRDRRWIIDLSSLNGVLSVRHAGG